MLFTSVTLLDGAQMEVARGTEVCSSKAFLAGQWAGGGQGRVAGMVPDRLRFHFASTTSLHSWLTKKEIKINSDQPFWHN